MRCWTVIGLLWAVGAAAGSPLHAQVPFNACLDRQGEPIPGIVDNSLSFAAEATFRDGHRIILWNQHNLSGTSSTLQLFVYLHECAHHSLNHLHRGESRTIEDQADCWAIQLLVDGGMINGSHLDALTRELKSMRGDANHLGGEALLHSLQGCLDVRVDPEAWNRALTVLTGAAHGGFQEIQGPPIPDAPGETYETTEGAPGTYDCELVRPPAVRCMVFAARKQKSAEQRFVKLVDIFHHWLPPEWTSTQASVPPAGLAREFLAQDGDAGTTIVLGLTTASRIYFLVKPGPGT